LFHREITVNAPMVGDLEGSIGRDGLAESAANGTEALSPQGQIVLAVTLRNRERKVCLARRTALSRLKEGSDMLVLSRKLGEKIFIGENICITVVDIDRGKIRLGIEAPRNVPIYRQELLPLGQTSATGAAEKVAVS
jgi:carbon storage regulator